MITKSQIAEKISAYLQHKISLKELVLWAENAQLEGNYDNNDFEVINESLSRIGVADVENFELLFEDYEKILRDLGYKMLVEIKPAA